MHKYFGINYEDPGVITKFKDEKEIKDLGWLDVVSGESGDVFRTEVTASGEVLIRRMLVELEEDEDDEEAEGELVIHDWELVA